MGIVITVIIASMSFLMVAFGVISFATAIIIVLWSLLLFVALPYWIVSKLYYCPSCGQKSSLHGKRDSQGLFYFACRCSKCDHKWTWRVCYWGRYADPKDTDKLSELR